MFSVVSPFRQKITFQVLTLYGDKITYMYLNGDIAEWTLVFHHALEMLTELLRYVTHKIT